MARGGLGVPAAEDGAVGERVVAPAVGGVARHAGVGGRVDPVALEAPAAVGGRHVPAGRLEPAVVVGQVDVARGGLGVPAADDGSVRLGVRPPARLRLGDEPALGEVSVGADPVALEAAGRAGGSRRDHAPVGDDACAALHVVGPAGVRVPAVLLDRLSRDGGRCLGGLDGARGVV